MRPALAAAASTARPTEASSVTSNSRTWIGSDSFCASVRISAAFLAFRPPGSRIVAKTVCPLRARVSVNSLPKPVLEPVTRTTCLEFILITPCLLRRYRAATTLMPEAKFGYRNEFSRLLTGENVTKVAQGSTGRACRILRLRAPFRRLHTFRFRRPARPRTLLLGYGAPHLSATGTSTLLNNALLTAHFRMPTNREGSPSGPRLSPGIRG